MVYVTNEHLRLKPGFCQQGFIDNKTRVFYLLQLMCFVYVGHPFGIHEHVQCKIWMQSVLYVLYDIRFINKFLSMNNCVSTPWQGFAHSKYNF